MTGNFILCLFASVRRNMSNSIWFPVIVRWVFMGFKNLLKHLPEWVPVKKIPEWDSKLIVAGSWEVTCPMPSVLTITAISETLQTMRWREIIRISWGWLLKLAHWLHQSALRPQLQFTGVSSKRWKNTSCRRLRWWWCCRTWRGLRLRKNVYFSSKVWLLSLKFQLMQINLLTN